MSIRTLRACFSFKSESLTFRMSRLRSSPSSTLSTILRAFSAIAPPDLISESL